PSKVTFTFRYVTHNAEQSVSELIGRRMRVVSGQFLQTRPSHQKTVWLQCTWKLKLAGLCCMWAWTNRLPWQRARHWRVWLTNCATTSEPWFLVPQPTPQLPCPPPTAP